jgi:transcriptional regulator with XRE-family HTH domain
MPGRRADENDAVVGDNIRAHRLARKMSQTALGREIGVTFQQVQKYEKGVNRVGSSRLVRLAGALGVPVTRLLDGVAVAHGEAASPVALIASARPLRLVRAYHAIGDDAVRLSLIGLTEQSRGWWRAGASRHRGLRAGRGARRHVDDSVASPRSGAVRALAPEFAAILRGPPLAGTSG